MLQNIPKEKILEILREGPTVPSKIVKRVGGDTMLVGAILSTMINSGDAAISSLKIGGSPLYYIPGEDEKLESFIDHLNDKDRKIFGILKEKKVLQDSQQDPLTRVSLRSMKDFAKSFEINTLGKKELFWRYHLYDRDSASSDAQTILDSQIPKVVAPPIIEKIEEIRPEIKIEKIETSIESKESKISQTEDSSETLEPVEPVVHKTHKAASEKNTEHSKEPKSPKETKEDFFEIIKKHVHNINLDIISKEKLKKTEYTLILKNHDTNEYIYCVAKDKKNINEGDLSTAFVFAHNKKMPCLFLATGDLTKKAEAMIHKEFKDMKIEKI